MAREPRTQIREKSGPLLVFASERGPCAPVREGERSAKKKEKRTIKTKLEKGSSVEREVWNSTSQNKM